MEKLLCDLCHPKQWKTISSSMLQSTGYPVYGANGIIGYYSEYNHALETLLITCRGATCGTLNICKPFSYVNGNAMALDDLSSEVDLHYLYYYLSARGLSDVITGSAQPQIVRQSLNKVRIVYPSLAQQHQIVTVLDKVTNLISQRRAQLDKLDLLVKSRFVEMFGDPVLNPMNWPSVPLSDMADIVSGITKGRKTKEHDLIEVPYMAVSNVKDGYIDWTTVKTIAATQAEIDQYRLLPDDVLMTEGGDPDKLGRGAIIKKPLENCIHQNHIFRVRLDEAKILPVYFAEYLQHQKAKQYFLRCAKQTTGIASINMTQLKGLPTLVPPTELQFSFNKEVEQINRTKTDLNQSLSKLETLKESIMQDKFGG